MSYVRYYKDVPTPYPLSVGVMTHVVKLEQREIRTMGFVLTVSEGHRGGGLREANHFVDATEAASNERLTVLCKQYEASGYSTTNSTNGFPQQV